MGSQRRISPIRIGMISAAGLVLFAGGAALADNSSHSFDDNVPPYQQSHYLNSYSRSSSTANSSITFTGIGGGQLMNVKAQNLQSGGTYTEKNGIDDDGVAHGIANSTPSGSQSRLIETNHDYNLLTVETKGSFIIH